MLIKSCIVAVCAAVALPAYAQKSPSEEQAFHSVINAHALATAPSEQEERDLYALVQALIVIKIQKNLGLDDEQALRLVDRVGAFKDELTRLRFDRSAARESLRHCIDADLHVTSIQEKLDALLGIEEESARLIRLMIEEAGRDLNVIQQAKLYLFIGDFEQDMRHLMQQARMRAHGVSLGDSREAMRESADSNAAFRQMLRSENRDVDLSESDEIDVVSFVDTLLMARLAQALELSPEETVVLFRRVGTYKDQLHRMKWQMGGSREELRAMIDSGDSPLTIARKLDDLLLQEEASAELLRSFVEGAREDVTVTQAADLYLFLGDFEQYVVSLLEMSYEAPSKIQP